MTNGEAITQNAVAPVKSVRQANDLLRYARLRTPSPAHPGRPMSRQELADAANAYLGIPIDDKYIGKLERGDYRWPSRTHRDALRTVLGASSDAELGFYINRPRPVLRKAPPAAAMTAVAHPELPDRPEPSAPDNDAERPFLTRVMEIVVRGDVVDASPAAVAGPVPRVRPEPPRRIGATDVARIEAATSVFRDWDNRWGGGLSHNAVVGQLEWVSACTSHSTFASTAVRDRLLTALSDLAGLAAFHSYDVNRHGVARSMWLLGLSAASEAGNVDLAGTTLRQLAHQALHLGQPDEGLRLVRLSYATSVHPAQPVSELALAEIAAFEGWCHAAAGRAKQCYRALGRAEEYFDTAEGEYFDTAEGKHLDNAAGEPPPPWLAHFDRSELLALIGHSYHVLAHHEPSAAERAITALREAIELRGDGYRRSKALNLIALSGSYFQLGRDVEEAVAVGDEALAVSGSLTSPRSLDRLRGLFALTTPHAAKPGVAPFRDRIQLTLTDE